MKQMKYKLIVSDLDGTLLDANQTIPESTKALIDKYRDQGGVFSIATGRMEASAGKYITALKINVPVILYNGAKIVNPNDGKVLFESLLDYDIAQKALANLYRYPWSVLVYKDKNIYIDQATDMIKEYAAKDGVVYQEVGDLIAFLDAPPTKILIIGEEERFAEFINTCLDQFGRPINTVCSEQFYLEILPDNVTKGTALAELCKLLKIDPRETIAIGDHLNDLAMIRQAGLGVAVNNAHRELKRHAGYVTAANDTCGVAEVLEMVLAGSL